MIKIHIDVDEKSDTKVEVSMKNVSVADLQSCICNIELMKMKFIGELANMTEFGKEVIDDEEDEE